MAAISAGSVKSKSSMAGVSGCSFECLWSMPQASRPTSRSAAVRRPLPAQISMQKGAFGEIVTPCRLKAQLDDEDGDLDEGKAAEDDEDEVEGEEVVNVDAKGAAAEEDGEYKDDIEDKVLEGGGRKETRRGLEAARSWSAAG